MLTMAHDEVPNRGSATCKNGKIQFRSGRVDRARIRQQRSPDAPMLSFWRNQVRPESIH